MKVVLMQSVTTDKGSFKPTKKGEKLPDFPKAMAEELIERGIARLPGDVLSVSGEGSDASQKKIAALLAERDALADEVARGNAVLDSLTVALTEAGGDPAAIIKTAVEAHSAALADEGEPGDDAPRADA